MKRIFNEVNFQSSGIPAYLKILDFASAYSVL